MDQILGYSELKDCHLGFIGAGNIALALVNGFINSGKIRAEQISVSAPTLNNLKKFKEFGCFTTNSNNEIFSHLSNNSNDKKCTKVVFLCVKPIVFKNNLQISVGQSMSEGEPLVVVSVMAGITINQIKEQMSSSLSKGPVRYARLMPNTAATVGAGICGTSIEDNDQPLKDFLTKLLSEVGLCQFVAEHHINAVCGMGGSGIAFVYSLIHAMSDGGLKMGLPRDVSNNIAAQTVLGAALMVLKTEKNPIVLRDEVTSPGGTTIHGLHALEKGAFNSVIMDAIQSATERANQLS